jgi:hypothetical protein
VKRYANLSLLEISTRLYGVSLAILLPFKFDIQTYGIIQFLLFTVSALGALVSGNARTLISKKRTNNYTHGGLKSYLQIIQFISTIGLVSLALAGLVLMELLGFELNRGLQILNGNYAFNFIVYVVWALALMHSSLQIGALISIDRMQFASVVNIVKLLIVMVCFMMAVDYKGFIEVLISLDVLVCTIYWIILKLRLPKSSIQSRKKVIRRILFMNSSRWLIVGNGFTLVGLWAFQLALSSTPNGAFDLGLFGLLNRYLMIMTFLPGILFQGLISFTSQENFENESLFKLAKQVTTLITYAIFMNMMVFSVTSYFGSDPVSKTLANVVILVSLLSFAQLLNNFLGTKFVQNASFTHWGISDVILGFCLIFVAIFVSYFNLPFNVSLLGMLLAYSLSIAYLGNCLRRSIKIGK